MGKGNRQRELARQRAQRQAARREAQRRKRRRQSLVTGGVVGTVLVLVGVLALAGVFSGSSNSKDDAAAAGASATPSASASVSPSADGPKTCTYTAAAGEDSAGKNPGLPPTTPAKTGLVQVSMKTNSGPLLINLDADKAPCTVNALAYLIDKKYYDDTVCHRVVTQASFAVLQCGDPTGKGTGGPGWTMAEENLPAADAKPAYPAGTVAMAKTNDPNTTGSQFFLVDKDTDLPASYTVVGKIVGGQANLDKIIKVGTDAAGGDGAPKVEVKLKTVTLK